MQWRRTTIICRPMWLTHITTIIHAVIARSFHHTHSILDANYQCGWFLLMCFVRCYHTEFPTDCTADRLISPPPKPTETIGSSSTWSRLSLALLGYARWPHAIRTLGRAAWQVARAIVAQAVGSHTSCDVGLADLRRGTSGSCCKPPLAKRRRMHAASASNHSL